MWTHNTPPFPRIELSVQPPRSRSGLRGVFQRTAEERPTHPHTVTLRGSHTVRLLLKASAACDISGFLRHILYLMRMCSRLENGDHSDLPPRQREECSHDSHLFSVCAQNRRLPSRQGDKETLTAHQVVGSLCAD